MKRETEVGVKMQDSGKRNDADKKTKQWGNTYGGVGGDCRSKKLYVSR